MAEQRDVERTDATPEYLALASLTSHLVGDIAEARTLFTRAGAGLDGIEQPLVLGAILGLLYLVATFVDNRSASTYYQRYGRCLDEMRYPTMVDSTVATVARRHARVGYVDAAIGMADSIRPGAGRVSVLLSCAEALDRV